MANSVKLFPNTYDQATLITDIQIRKEDYAVGVKTLTFSGSIKSRSAPKRYPFTVSLFPVLNPKEPIEAKKVKAQVRCGCPAFPFFAQNAIYRKTSLHGKPSKWARTPAPIRNPKKIPGLCKHLLGFFLSMRKAGRLKGY